MDLVERRRLAAQAVVEELLPLGPAELGGEEWAHVDRAVEVHVTGDVPGNALVDGDVAVRFGADEVRAPEAPHAEPPRQRAPPRAGALPAGPGAEPGAASSACAWPPAARREHRRARRGCPRLPRRLPPAAGAGSRSARASRPPPRSRRR